MKRIFSFIVAISIATTIMGQVPESFKYQSVLRNSRGDVRANTATTIMIDILQGSSTGTTVFSETHHVTTDNFGLINLEIGRGESRVGSMSSIDWRLGSYFIKTTVDDIEMGTSQLLSVPYALHAKTAEQVSGTARETDPVFITSPAIKITTTDVGNWASAYNWGNHATAGYLKSLVETDPYVAAINGLVKSNGFTISAAIAGTDYLTRSDSAANVTGIVSGANGGTGIDNRGKTISLGGNLTTSGAFPTTLISTANTNITLPASGTLATLAGFEALSNKTINNLTPYALAAGFSIKGGTIASKTLTVIQDASVSGTNTGDQDLTGLTHTNRSALDLVSGTNTGD